MSEQGERIVECPASGQTFAFSDSCNTSDGKVKTLRYTLAPGKFVLPHFHPATAQTFKVLSGELNVRVRGRKIVLKAGDEVGTLPGDEHSQWNSGLEPAVVIEGYNPPLDIEPFFTILSRAQEGRSLFKFFVFLSDYREVVGAKAYTGRAIVSVLGAIGKRLGYRDWYLPHISHLKR